MSACRRAVVDVDRGESEDETAGRDERKQACKRL
jgi:hypothetical protein